MLDRLRRLSLFLGVLCFAAELQSPGAETVAEPDTTKRPLPATTLPGRSFTIGTGVRCGQPSSMRAYYGRKNRVRQISEPAAQFSKRMLEEMIDEEAAAHVDASVLLPLHGFLE